MVDPLPPGGAPAQTGSGVRIEFDDPSISGTWLVVRHDDGWRFGDTADDVIAGMRATTDQLWRLLTNNHRPGEHGPVELTGDAAIGRTLLLTRSIIGEPK